MKDLTNENVIQQEKNGIEYLQFRKLLEYPELKHMYVLKNTNMNFALENGNKEKLCDNYRRVCELEEIDFRNIVKSSQAHTDKIKCICKKVLQNQPDMYIPELNNIDGLISNKENIVLSTTNADCILLIMYDTKNKVIANIHSGWRGTFQKIAQKAVKKMQIEYGTKPKDIICCMSPSIAKCCFEVEEDVKNKCEEIFSNTGRIQEIIERGRKVEERQKYNIDTILINKLILQEAGLAPENIVDSGLCTVCHSDLFHSYRVDKEQSGRNGAFIGMI